MWYIRPYNSESMGDHLQRAIRVIAPVTPKSIPMIKVKSTCINTLRPRQNGRHFPDDIFTCIFLNEHVWISNKISLKFFPKEPINNIPVLVQIMSWRRSVDKPLSEPLMVRLSMHICVTRPQWVKPQQNTISRFWYTLTLGCTVVWSKQRNTKWYKHGIW